MHGSLRDAHRGEKEEKEQRALRTYDTLRSFLYFPLIFYFYFHLLEFLQISQVVREYRIDRFDRLNVCRVARIFARWFANGHGPASGSRRALASASESKIARIGGARKGRVRDRDDALSERRRNTEKAATSAANRVINDARSAPT